MSDLCVFFCTVHHVIHQQGYAIIERYLVLQATIRGSQVTVCQSLSLELRDFFGRISVTPETQILICPTGGLLERYTV